MEQSEIIVNYLTDKYGGDEPEKKRLRYEKTIINFYTVKHIKLLFEV